MGHLSIFLVLLSVFQGSTQADLEAVKQIEQRFTTTLVKKDADSFGELLADDIVHIGFEGQSAGKAEYMIYFKHPTWQYKKYERSNLSVRLLGRDVGVVTGRVDRSIVIEGKETTGPFAFTHVWTKVGDRWLLKSSQFTTIPTPKPQE
jgi:ketosteroid isomerase-like protein